MNVSDWITLAAVLVALGFGVSSLIQTQMLRKKDRKERLLNEIIEWAIEVAKCGLPLNFQEPSPIFSKLYEKEFREYPIEDKKKLEKGIMLDQDRIGRSHYMSLHSNYRALEVKGEYILSLGEIETCKNIHTDMKIVKEEIHDVLVVMWDYLLDFNNDLKKQEAIKKEEELQESAVSLIKEATKIKVKDIS